MIFRADFVLCHPNCFVSFLWRFLVISEIFPFRAPNTGVAGEKTDKKVSTLDYLRHLGVQGKGDAPTSAKDKPQQTSEKDHGYRCLSINKS